MNNLLCHNNDSRSHRIPGLAPLQTQVTSTLDISLMFCSFFGIDVTCSPRELAVHMHILKPKSIIYLDI